MYFKTSAIKREIANLLDVSTDFVVEWTKSENQDFEQDDRGREKGDRQKWNQEVVDQIEEIREELSGDPEKDFWGPTAIEVEFRKRHPDTEVPPARTIGKILSDLGLTENQTHSSKSNALHYLHYPEMSLYQLVGDRVLEADFVGDKFITGRSEPIHFLGYSFKHPPEMKHYVRVEGETSDALLEHTKAFFDRFERTQMVNIDNAAAAIGGGGGHKRTISRMMKYLLEQQVYPVYSVPRKPATQASIEGSNSMFSRKFWNAREYEDLGQIDDRLETFNENIRRYHQYESPEQSEGHEKFEPAVYFLRQVREREEGEGGMINVMNEEVALPEEYIKYFVMGEWRLSEEQLRIRFEKREGREQQEEEKVRSEVIRELEFSIHEASKKRCEDLLS